MSEARNIAPAFGKTRLQVEAAVTIDAYQVFQGPNGEACVYDNATAASATSYIEPTTRGRFNVVKTASVVFLKGCRVYWDHSANACTFRKVNDRDFYTGRAAEDATSASTFAAIDLNADPPYDLDLLRDPYTTVAVGTQALGGFLPPARAGGALHFLLSATNEAQKVDALSVDGFAEEANAIIEFAFRVISDGAGTVVDVSMGIANATHATDADAITESVFIHLDANNTNINAESDDGTTEVAATDTTKDYSEGAAVANRVLIWLDMRDPADVQIYVDAVNVLPASVFDVDAGTGPWKLLVHVEKSAATDAYELAIDWMRAWFAEQ